MEHLHFCCHPGNPVGGLYQGEDSAELEEELYL